MVSKASDAVPNKALHRLRAAAGHSQQEVADALNALAATTGRATGITANQISRWERGTVRPHPIYRRLLAEHFGVSVGELGLAGEQRPSNDLVGKSAADVSTVTSVDTGETAGVTTGWFRPTMVGRPPRVAICGSRSIAADGEVIDASIVAVSRWLMSHRYEISHGPRGIGIEIVTYIANHYRPPGLGVAVGIFGHRNVVHNADYVLVFGGGQGTLDEIDLALSMEKKIIPFAASGGAARVALDRLRFDLRLREWITQDLFGALGSCSVADGFIELAEQIIVTDRRSDIRE
jgi:transcriptional regulator with XRE-family HTH domain